MLAAQNIGWKNLNYFGQPIVNSNAEVSAYECLIRDFRHGNILSPDEFFSSLKIDDWGYLWPSLLDKYIFIQRTMPGMKFTLNVNSVDLAQNSIFVQLIKEQVSLGLLDPHCLIIELTERIPYSPGDVADSLNSFFEMGIKCVLDDFGSGYANLAAFGELPFQGVKIDRGIVAEVCTSKTHRVIIESVLDIASAKGNCSVTAEGIEEFSQFELLKQLGVGYFQGYLFGKPAPFQTVFYPFSKGHTPRVVA
ncbi:EAL domain-containing protein [Shewanella sp. Iso12]|uniref:EAL domain-containing protein n=1 Tax=Shewanella sp. Iso12 TaxID=1826753 RepID=UPI00142FA6D6|nr:EAL domain-containing protein [Shewanella sp. Iso12]NJI86940.1 EAL domain-containing protein [Shewanella sp. Iso12]